MQRSPDTTLEAAPVAACALVFSESNLEPSEVETCLKALSSAYLQLLVQGILGPQDAYVEKAFESLLAGNRVVALQFLKRAASAMAGAIDAWETGRVAGAS
jgi:branched-subunit amino acid transport protein AzlD